MWPGRMLSPQADTRFKVYEVSSPKIDPSAMEWNWDKRFKTKFEEFKSKTYIKPEYIGMYDQHPDGPYHSPKQPYGKLTG